MAGVASVNCKVTGPGPRTGFGKISGVEVGPKDGEVGVGVGVGV